MAVKLLLQFNQSFHDGSGCGHTVTTPGYFTFLTESPFGTGLQANMGRVWLDDHTDWQLNTGDFTIDFWVKINSSSSSYQYPFELGENQRLALRFSSSGRYVRFYVNGSSQDTANSVFWDDTWFHTALIRSGGVFRLFISGVQVLEWSNSDALTPTGGFAIGNSLTGSEAVAGIAEFRLSNEVETAWWNGFTPPSAPYIGTAAPVIPEDTGGDFLLPFDNNYYAFNRSEETTSPHFNGCYGFEDGFSGKSIRFKYGNLFYENHDGLKLGGENFTLDFRVRFDSFNNYFYLLDTTGSSDYLKIRINSGGGLRVYLPGFSWDTASGVLQTNTWYHIALVRTGGLFIVYVDGVMKSTYWTSPEDLNPNGNLYVGATENDEGNHLFGQLEDIRFTQGTARWVTDFDASQVTISYPAMSRPSRDKTASFLLHFNESFADISEALPLKNGCYGFEGGVFGKAVRFKYGNIKYENLDSLKLGTGDFTLDFRVRADSLSSYTYLFDSADASYPIKLRLNTDGGIRLYLPGSSWDAASGLIQTGRWYHIALVRVSRVFLLYIDGSLIWETVFTPQDINPSGNLYLGSAENSESSFFNGLLDEFRIVKGSSVWIEDFTPPTAEYSPATPSVPEPNPSPDFVCHFDEGIYDSSGNNHAVTEAGEVAYLAGKFNQSAEFDGSEYATIGSPSDWQVGTGSFTLDTWVKLPANYTAGRYLFDLGGYQISARTSNSTYLRIYFCGSSFDLPNIPVEKWFHLAICRLNRCLLIYLNGTLKYSTTLTGTIAPTANFRIGSDSSGSNAFIGELDELRLYKSAGVFDREFTPPTSPQADAPVTATPAGSPKILSPTGDAYSQNQLFRWTRVFQADRYEIEWIGLETVSDYPNRSLNKTLSLGSCQWRVRAGNSFGYGPWCDTVTLTIHELVLTSPLCGQTLGWPEYLSVLDGLSVVTLKYAETGVGNNNEEGWKNTAGTLKLYWDSSNTRWIFKTSDVTIYSTKGTWSLNGSTPSDGFQIEYDDSQMWFFYLAPTVAIAAGPPVAKNGSCPLRAWDWDFDQSENGETISGRTANDTTGHRRDYWRLKLRSGQVYTFTVRMTAGLSNMMFRLLDRDGKTQLSNGVTSSSTTATFSYTPILTGEYFLIADSCAYGYYGTYSMQCSPTPLRGTFSLTPCIFSCRQSFMAERPDSFEAIRYQTLSMRPDRIDIAAVADHIHPVIFAIRSRSEAIAQQNHSVRHLANGNAPIENTIREKQNQSSPRSARVFTRTSWEIYARNAETDTSEYLGFIPTDAPGKKLENVSLADGTYEIEVRPSDLFWPSARTRKLFTLQIDACVIKTAGLPVIQNLKRIISNFQPILKWEVAAEYAPAEMHFAIWFCSTTPVSTTGVPDATVSYVDGRGEYQLKYKQTESMYAAVAAITDDRIGPITEIHLHWSTIPPISPPNQTAFL